MNNPSNCPSRAPSRVFLLTSASALALIFQSSCGLGLGKKDDPDDVAAVIESQKPKETWKGSLFRQSKSREAWINEDLQTTRRDRYAAQTTTNFGTSDAAEMSPFPEAAMGTPKPSAGEPRVPSGDFALDPDPAAPTQPRVPTSSDLTGRPVAPERSTSEETLRLPTLDTDFPQPNQPSVAADPAPSRLVDDEGYTPLQPKLPGAEPIQPPSE